MVGNVAIGGNNPIPVQTMTNTKTGNVKATIEQIKQLENAGADIIRVTVNDAAAANGIAEIVNNSSVPIVADIHFNHIFALKSIEAGVAKVRINPGNIGSEDKIKQVLDAAKNKHIPIRIGVNSGSLEKILFEKYSSSTAEALVESALRHIEIANKYDFDALIIAVKASSVQTTIDAYRLLSPNTYYPLHLGVTEAGSIFTGTIKSSVALSILLSEGIGDTIRISLTGNPVKEVEAGIQLLSALELRDKNIELISCPTCGRMEIDTVSIVEELEEHLNKYQQRSLTCCKKHKLKIAIMGCVVNGPGEAREADIAICCGKNEALLFIKGIEVNKIKPKNIIKRILCEIEKYFVN
jgi:(E)-4-hydroxy-3-methylbut-2-enyl-diphosphate synthase